MFFSRLGTDPDKVFPYEEFMKQCQKYGCYAAFVGVPLLPILYTDRQNMPDMEKVFHDFDVNKLEKVLTTFESNEAQQAYSKRVVDIFDDMARFNYI